MNLFTQTLGTLDYVLIGLGAAAMLVMMIAFVFMIKLFFTVPDMESWRNGKELSVKLHEAAGTNIHDAQGRIFFYWRLFPLVHNIQIMPYFAASFKRYSYAMESITWTSLGIAKKQAPGKFMALIFSEILANLMIIGGLIWAIVSYFSYQDSSQVNEMVQAVAGALIMIGGFALYIYPTYFLKKYMLPIIDKANITPRDKKRLRTAINMMFFIAIAAIIIKILEILVKIAKAIEENKK